MKKFVFTQYHDGMKFPDGIYNALYNKEPTVIRIKDGKPAWVQFIGFMKEDEPRLVPFLMQVEYY